VLDDGRTVAKYKRALTGKFIAVDPQDLDPDGGQKRAKIQVARPELAFGFHHFLSSWGGVEDTRMDAKKLYERIKTARELLGEKDLQVVQAEKEREQARQSLIALNQRFNETLVELAEAQGVDPASTKFDLNKFEFVKPPASSPPPPNGVEDALS
jgi:hypothetical protein